MAVSVFPAAALADFVFRIPTASTDIRYVVDLPAGVYQAEIFSDTGVDPAATLQAFGEIGPDPTALASVTFLDYDASSASGVKTVTFSIAAKCQLLTLNSTIAGYVRLMGLNQITQQFTGIGGTLVTLTTSQSYTVSVASHVSVIGGGGGGGYGGGATGHVGGGGGSGYLTKASVNPGTYSVVIGAGGALNGGNGGTSSFGAVTAAGGLGVAGQNSAGANGGSGGGSSYNNGGFNGSNGFGSGGTGSGVKVALYSPSSVGGVWDSAGNRAGKLYGGGSGGRSGQSGGETAAANTGGGGSGGGNTDGSSVINGGAGGSGVVLVWRA